MKDEYEKVSATKRHHSQTLLFETQRRRDRRGHTRTKSQRPQRLCVFNYQLNAKLTRRGIKEMGYKRTWPARSRKTTALHIVRHSPCRRYGTQNRLCCLALRYKTRQPHCSGACLKFCSLLTSFQKNAPFVPGAAPFSTHFNPQTIVILLYPTPTYSGLLQVASKSKPVFFC